MEMQNFEFVQLVRDLSLAQYFPIILSLLALVRVIYFQCYCMLKICDLFFDSEFYTELQIASIREETFDFEHWNIVDTVISYTDFWSLIKWI